ncbi:MAG: spore coat U domain-containing protein [Beijerinckiaceae bacterium]|nr:spore coat U domain-containing protein [Beijerinckiaceae bacterium]
MKCFLLIWFRLLVLPAAVLMAPRAQANPVCSFTISDINFGNIDLTTNSVFTATGTLTATCFEENTNQTVTVCPSIGEGTGGAGSSGSVRYMLNGANQLQYNLYQDAAMTQVWGSMYWAFPPQPPSWVFAKPGFTVVATRTIYARIPAGQTALPTATYSSSFSGINARIEYKAGPESCNTIHNSADGTVDVSFSVTAINTPSCSVSATTLNFGNTGVLTANVDATNSVSVTCNNGTPYTVALDGGLSGATDPAQRKMTLAGNQVTYALYRDSARLLPWGSTSGVDTLSATGTGSVQPHTVYGRVPPQTTPQPGTYTDTIVVTVTY